MLTLQEQERIAFCNGSPMLEIIGGVYEQACEIESLEAEVAALQQQVDELEHWKDGGVATELAEAQSSVATLTQRNRAAMQMLRDVMSELEGKGCGNAAGRKDLAHRLKNFLIQNR